MPHSVPLRDTADHGGVDVDDEIHQNIDDRVDGIDVDESLQTLLRAVIDDQAVQGQGLKFVGGDIQRSLSGYVLRLAGVIETKVE
jgi:hypothetical protein